MSWISPASLIAVLGVVVAAPEARASEERTHDRLCLVTELPEGQPLPDVCVIKPF